MNEVKAELVRSDVQAYIEVYLPGLRQGGRDLLFSGLIDHCAKSLSPNELRKVLVDCEAQLRKLGPENTPPIFQEMVNDLRATMTRRGISFEPPLPQITIVIGSGPRTRRLIKVVKEFFPSIKDKAMSLLKRAGLALKFLEAKEVRNS